MKLHHPTPPRTLFASCTAVWNDHDSSPIATSEDHDRDAEALDLVRVAQLLDALVERERAADGEQHDGDDERPEVALASVAEGMEWGRGALRAGTAEDQEELVAGVGDGVDGLGEQRRRAGDEEADELRDRDPEVRQEGGDDRLAAAVLHRLTLAQRTCASMRSMAGSARGSRRVGHGGRPGDRGRHLARSCRRRSVDRRQLPARRRGREGDGGRDRSGGRFGPVVRRRGRGLRGRADDGGRRGQRLRLRRHPRAQRRHRLPRQVGGRHRRRRARAARAGARAERASAGPARAAVDAHAATAATS